MTNQERIDQYNQRIELLKEYGLPINNTCTIDEAGNFQFKELFEKYKGRVVGDGVVYYSIYDNPQDAMDEFGMGDYRGEEYGTLVAENIDGINFSGRRSASYIMHGINGKKGETGLKEKMESIYESYAQIIDEIKKGTSDEEITKKFGLSQFKHENSKKKSM